jgi:predicted 3-demethylubiquinone-9 3-methyltransferase (glyoxalase superfamily)
MKQRLGTCLWFDTQAEAAAKFYTSIFKNSKLGPIARYGDTGPGPAGSVMTVSFELEGQSYLGLNGGPMFKFSEAISLIVNCKDQAEIDYYWEKLLADGGKPSQCGWLKDKFGLSWQVAPGDFLEKAAQDPAGMNRVMSAVMKMVKLDLPTMQKAFDRK